MAFKVEPLTINLGPSTNLNLDLCPTASAGIVQPMMLCNVCDSTPGGPFVPRAPGQDDAESLAALRVALHAALTDLN